MRTKTIQHDNFGSHEHIQHLIALSAPISSIPSQTAATNRSEMKQQKLYHSSSHSHCQLFSHSPQFFTTSTPCALSSLEPKLQNVEGTSSACSRQTFRTAIKRRCKRFVRILQRLVCSRKRRISHSFSRKWSSTHEHPLCGSPSCFGCVHLLALSPYLIASSQLALPPSTRLAATQRSSATSHT